MPKRIVSLFLVLSLAFTLCSFSLADKAEEPVVLNNALELISFCDDIHRGQINLVKAQLYRSDSPEEVYLIYLNGTGFDFKKLNNPIASIACGLSITTDYLRTLITAAENEIPEGSKIVLAGHSLGGMIAQQFAADPEMKERYEIINILAAGSPIVATGIREGSINRIADGADVVPYLTLNVLRNLLYHINREFSGTLFAYDAHQSYFTSAVWAQYDCFGVKGGNVKISCRESDFIFYN